MIGTSSKLYLAVILDLFSRFVVGWAVSAVNDRHLTIKALEMALKRRCPRSGCCITPTKDQSGGRSSGLRAGSSVTKPSTKPVSS